jgi:hypothetical protein
MKVPLFKQRRVGEDVLAGSYTHTLPEIDKKRAIALYVRQSGKDADDKYGESRKTQLQLVHFARTLAGDSCVEVRVYDEGAGRSGQLRIDERKELNRLWADIDKGDVGTIIVAREDRLFRDKHGSQSGTFTDKAEKMRVVVIVPPLSSRSALKYYDFTNYNHLRAFQDKMRMSYDFIETHVNYMHLNQLNKSGRGCYDGRTLPPGLVIPLFVEKMEQRPVIYEPWAEKMRWVFAVWKEFDYSVSLLTREIERLPYLFPLPQERDDEAYMFRSTLTRVRQGFKPKSPETIRRWLRNVHLIGWWPVSEESGEVIVDNHDAVIERAPFEEGYIHLTGYTLDGVPVPEWQERKQVQVRKIREMPPQALLHGNAHFCSPLAHSITVAKLSSPRDHYLGRVKNAEGIYTDNVFSLPCVSLDMVIVERLAALAEADKQLAKKIQAKLEQVSAAQIQECISINDQIESIDGNLKELRSRLIAVEGVLDDDEAIIALATKINALKAQKGVLEEKKNEISTINGQEEVQQFYRTLGNFTDQWPRLTLGKKQKMLRLLTKKIEIEPLSTHWLRLTIHWIGPVLVRPDIALIWRVYGSKGPQLQQWEKDLIQRYYPGCEKRTDLLQLLPNRTWEAISVAARRMGLSREQGAGKIRDAVRSATWQDLQVIPDYHKALQMIATANKACDQSKRDMFAFWLIAPDLAEIEKPLHVLLEYHANTDIFASEVNAS